MDELIYLADGDGHHVLWTIFWVVVIIAVIAALLSFFRSRRG